MKWMVAVDLDESCEGALGWARWLRTSDADAQLVVAHAVDIVTNLAPPRAQTVMRHVREFVQTRLPEVEMRVLEERPPEAALARALSIHAADALVIGRRATRDGGSIVRLGPVARRLLRRLPGPVLVCPPDMVGAEVAAGPVLVCVDGEGEDASALAFGRALADATGLPLQAITVSPPAFASGVTYLPTAAHTVGIDERHEASVRAWLAEQPGEPVELLVASGRVIPSILRASDEVGASMLVCGSRLLSATERIFNTSVGTALAATARIPVAVVPPTA